MAEAESFLGLSRGAQIAIISVVGGVLVFLGLAGSSTVDPQYDPLPFGVGLVMVLYAAGVGVHDWWRNRD